MERREALYKIPRICRRRPKQFSPFPSRRLSLSPLSRHRELFQFIPCDLLPFKPFFLLSYHFFGYSPSYVPARANISRVRAQKEMPASYVVRKREERARIKNVECVLDRICRKDGILGAKLSYKIIQIITNSSSIIE